MTHADPDQLSDLLDTMRAAQRAQPHPTADMRRQRLDALAALLGEHQDAICAAIDADFGGRPTEETQLLELFPSLQAVRHARGHLRRWMKPKRHLAGLWFLPARTLLVPRPLGVVGIIVPWNYPLFLAVGPLVDALAAGNRAMVKMSEYTPRFAALFADLIAQYFPEGEVCVVNGDASVAQAFSALPFDHLLFTGSTAVGRHVMRAAAANLTPVTLELGGKSPAIIGPGARFEAAVERIVYGKCVNAGQTCIAPDYVLLPRGREADFIACARRVVARMYPQLAAGGQYASIVDAAKHARLLRLRDEAVERGAKAHALASSSSDDARRVLPPTVLTDTPDAAGVMQEEIFGPLLPVVPYDELQDALDYIAARPHPLALYLFDDDRAVQRRVERSQLAGGMCINDTLYHVAQHHLPFGGVGASGLGAYHGEAGFRTFSKMLPVFRQTRLNGVGLLNPPYGARFRRMMGLLLRR
ncbi:coniferyl aldehyde dehydrogenase [Oleiagrimonas soli]|uniref:Aldehyde dehydrogenase n=1 Tax=Oleiagrimonas soli TaxID=1543381 RepID=A0A099CYZ3_9GAMM|nr:coniferyl aldehyde dehydrogenase [Oleiagrimonas soli]KGI79203.1 aldehyde dehydrogenase [Oleiagrimonas soli]MBB6184806.1 coniferyl-aldehyde dehydrogenase [Oleiagrimonas soli]